MGHDASHSQSFLRKIRLTIMADDFFRIYLTLDSHRLFDSSKTCGGVCHALIGLVNESQSPNRPLDRTREINSDRSPAIPPQRKRRSKASHCHGFSDSRGDKLGLSAMSFPSVVPGQTVVSYCVFRTIR